MTTSGFYLSFDEDSERFIWLPRLDSNQDYKSQSLASYQLDDRAVNFSKSSCQKSLEQKILLRPYGYEKIFPISWR